MRLPRPFALGAIVLAVAVLGFAVATYVSDRGSASNGPPSLPESDGPILVYREFAPGGDSVFAVDPADPESRVELATIAHAWGYATYPSLAPDGSSIAYTLLPPEGGAGQLHLLDIATGEVRVLASNVDPIAPVWSPASDAVVVRNTAPDGTSAKLLRVELDGAATTLVTADAGLFPFEVSPDGAWIYYASLTTAGTDAMRAPLAGGAPEVVAHLSDGVARDWDLSPDGARLAYLAQADGPTTFVAEVRDLATGTTNRPVSGLQFAPAWRSSAALTVGRLDAGEPGTAAAQVALEGSAAAQGLPAPSEGFDVPISWSAGGSHLVVRHFLGDSAADPGPSRLVVIGPDGSRTTVSTSSDVAVAGWLEVTP